MKLLFAMLLLGQAACTTSRGAVHLDHPAAKAERLGPICRDCLDA